MKATSIALLAGIAGLRFVLPISGSDAATWNEKVLYSFCSERNCTDGATPSDPIDVNGLFYGVTVGGGRFGSGTVFSLDPASGVEKVLFAFCRQHDCADGENPSGALVAANGLLYGTTTVGGTHNNGTVFQLAPNGAEKVLYSFCSQANCADGADPGALIHANGLLYGTTFNGGTENEYCGGYVSCGTVFSLNPYTGAETVLYAFCSQGNCSDGAFPGGELIDVNGTLYGTTLEGGAGNGGTVFAVNPRTRTETVLYSFCSQQNCVDGDVPDGLIGVNGILYGTTEYGGTGEGNYCNPGCGTVFSLDPGTGAEKVLYSFTGGISIPGGLIAGKDRLYGTTQFGGLTNCAGFGCGTVFSFNPRTNTERVLYTFCSQQNCPDGEGPGVSITVKGTLFGSTGGGGANGYGTWFELEKQR